MWIIDFGVGTTQAEAALYEAPFEYLRAHAEQSRAASRSRIRRWWLHERPRGDMREATRELRRYLATPTVARHRLFVWLSAETLPDHQLIVVARDDDYTLGAPEQRAAIETAARRLHELREGWLNPAGGSEAELAKRTLTNLYNARPTWLIQAHDTLDQAVLDAYGWPHDMSDEDLLAGLLALNFEREPVAGNGPETD